MEWIRFKDNKPKEKTLALVSNEKGWMTQEKAIYYPEMDVWILLNPNESYKLTLDVTHYLIIPEGLYVR